MLPHWVWIGLLAQNLLGMPYDWRKLRSFILGHLGVRAMMKSPCWALSCFADAKLASPKLAKQTSPMGSGRTITDVSENACASRSTLFPSKRVSTVAWLIPFWRFATFVAMSGLECTAAYWRLPHKSLSCCSSLGVILSSSWFLLAFGILMGPILFTYLLRLILTEKSGNCSTSKPVNLKRLYSLEPKGNVFWSSARAFRSFGFPLRFHRLHESLKYPKIPSSWFGFGVPEEEKTVIQWMGLESYALKFFS